MQEENPVPISPIWALLAVPLAAQALLMVRAHAAETQC